MNKTFETSTAIITGAASGLGFAIAKKLFQLKVKLALFDFNEDLLSRLKQEIQEDMRLYKVDVTSEINVKKAVDEVAHDFGSIDILVNSAGITGKTGIKSHDVDYENIKSVFDVNFGGSF